MRVGVIIDWHKRFGYYEGMYGFGGLQDGANKTKMLIVGGVVLLVIVAGVVGVIILQHKDDNSGATNQQKTATNQDDANTSERIIQKVGALYDVPVDEEPTVAAIQDRSKLDGQKFFDKAQDGDYLLVYSKAELALLYRESIDKLVNVGPVNLQDAEQPSSTSNGTSGQQ